ncbi:hypothetical protein DFH09DRAFT_1333001 [Mycena vulgaris]|nr:hypothetical protein DFH09DRAFT_1333001 [Mycena vulgaris]
MTYPKSPPQGESWPLFSCNQIPLDEDGVSAWNLLLSAEKAALALPKLAAKHRDKLVAVRLVAWFGFPQYGQIIPYERLLLKVNSCNHVAAPPGDPAKLEQRHNNAFVLGLDLRNHLLRVFYSRTDRTPTHICSCPPVLRSAPSSDPMLAIDGVTSSASSGILRGVGFTTNTLTDPIRRALPEITSKMLNFIATFDDAEIRTHKQAKDDVTLMGLPEINAKSVAKDPHAFIRNTVLARHSETFFRQVPKPSRTVTLRLNPQANRDCETHGIPRHLLKLPDPQLMAMRAGGCHVGRG